uniref:Uncharacterized protein n=1 Tax=Oryza sativa subsp. japonica TaxID=39947 RepID=Q6ATD4_ORYSJ|nr:hypothetical protein [Oryza sativa Japonica Group]
MRTPHVNLKDHANDYRHRYTGTGVDNRTTGTGRHRKDEGGEARGRILTTTRRGVGTTTTNGRGEDSSGTTEANGEGTTSAAILGQGLTTRSRGRRRGRGCRGLLDGRGRQTRTARRRDERHDDRERREDDDDDDDRDRRGGDKDSWQRLHGDEDGVEHAAAMMMTEAAPRDDEPGDRRDVDRRGRTVTRKR